ncbi:sensor histidine kinase [Spirochaeta cellobiosiphila]|uniref:sensor histidine kinase n=1 Tax=Spirochaeta cellobiosiphila TaxID=504483 RepID=UPI0004286727|nr:ATP-binding protein [Spirochaeta cellobiosiphila]
MTLKKKFLLLGICEFLLLITAAFYMAFAFHSVEKWRIYKKEALEIEKNIRNLTILAFEYSATKTKSSINRWFLLYDEFDQSELLLLKDPNPEYALRKFKDQMPILKNLFEQIITYRITPTKDSQDYLTHLTVMFLNLSQDMSNNAQSYVYLMIDRVDILQSRIVITVIFITIALLCLSIGTYYYINKSIFKPLFELVALSREVGKGHLEHRSSIKREDELGVLVNSFNQMLDDINQQIEKEEEIQKQLLNTMDGLQKSNSDLEQFAYVASHDLQEPLRKILNFTELFSKKFVDIEDEKAKRYIYYITDGAMRMQNLIRDLLSYSRIMNNQIELEIVDMNEVLTAALTQLDVKIKESKTRIVKKDLPMVLGMASMLTQLYQNLIGNAMKFQAPDRKPVIEVGYTEEADQYTFYVKDNGIGISKEYQEKIFIIFQRLHGKSEYDGNGLGLAICTKIANRHKGQLWVESTVGEGSTFYFNIPVHH